MKFKTVAGIDVHKRVLAVVVRLMRDGKVVYEQRKYGTTVSQIQILGEWLQQHQVEEVAMESTAQYWRPVWYWLEEKFSLHLCHPLQTRAPKGRKSDYRDAKRLADRWAAGELEDSFVPGKEQRMWRGLTRARVQMKKMLGVLRNHVECILERDSIKITSVVSDAFGASGWAILKKLVAGETSVQVLVAEARGKLRQKEAQLQEALAGRLEAGNQLLLRQSLEQVEMIWKQIDEINKELAKAMKDFTAVLVRLSKVPGVDMYAAQELLAEIGPKAAMFPSADQFASWVGLCPGSQESAGVNYSSRSAKGNRYLRRLLCQIAWGAIHTKNTVFAGLFARLKPRIEGKGAAWAVAHHVAKVIWVLLHREVEYIEKGNGVNPQNLARKFRRIVKELARHGIDPRNLLPPPTSTPTPLVAALA
jgi:transposase